MKGLMIIAKNFEDSEALTTLDILKRAKITMVTASVSSSCEVNSQTGLKIVTDVLLRNINYKNYDFLVIPGGKAVFEILDLMSEIDEIIKYYILNNKLSCYICAAPHLPGKLGLLKGKKYTCYPGCNKSITDAIYQMNNGVVVDTNIITAKSMAYSIDFALEIISVLLGKNQKEKIEKSLYGIFVE